MTDEARDYDAEIAALFEGQEPGQRVVTIAKGRTGLGDFTITIEQTLPENAEAIYEGAIEQTETAFHAAFGRRAKHVNPETGEEDPDLRSSIIVQIDGDPNYEAVAETRERMEQIITEAVEAAKQSGMDALLRNAITPGPEQLN
jgi:hypothetical protein